MGKGALFWAAYGDVNTNLPGTVDPSTTRLTYFSFVPGIEWDISSKNGGNAKGAYSGRVGVELEFQGTPISTQYVRANAVLTTDVETSAARVYGAEIAWQPKISSLNINTTRQIDRNLGMMFGFFPTLNVDYFYAGETAKFPNLTKGQGYLWVGPKAEATVYFRKGSPLERFSITGEYFYLYDVINGNSTAVNYGRASANYKILDWKSAVDATQMASMSLAVRYTKGRTPRTLERVDEFYTGVTLLLGRIPPSEGSE